MSAPNRETQGSSDDPKDHAKKAKATGDDQGKAWEINDAGGEDDDQDDHLESRFDEEYQGEAWTINTNTEGDDG